MLRRRLGRVTSAKNENAADDAKYSEYSAQPDDFQNGGAVGRGAGIVLVAKQQRAIDGRADFPRRGVDQAQTHIAAGIFDAVKIARDSAVGSEEHNATGVGKKIILGVEGVAEIGGFGGGVDAFFRAGQKMPAGGSFWAPKMRQRGILFLRGHVRGLAWVKADEDHFIIATRCKGQHAQRPYDALFHLITQYRAAVINKSQNHRLLLEIIAQPYVGAVFVDKRQIERDLRVKLRIKSDVLQLSRHGRGINADIAGNRLAARKANADQQYGNRRDGACSIHESLFLRRWC